MITAAVSSVQVVGCNITTKQANDIKVFTNAYPFFIDESNFTIDEAVWTNWSLPSTPIDPALTLVRKDSVYFIK